MSLSRASRAFSGAASFASTCSGKLKLALCQMAVGTDKQANLNMAGSYISKAVAAGAELISLPECFNCPYSNDAFPEYAEVIPESGEPIDEVVSPSMAYLSNCASSNGVYLIGGSIPERCTKSGSLFNTSVAFDTSGNIIAKHRKVHLFDIDVPASADVKAMRFMESETLSPGNCITTFDIEGKCRVGLGICYDVRFPEFCQATAEKGCSLMVFPSAFNTTTGPLHWELLQRSRALDNQCFFAMASPSRSQSSSYQAWGHSTVCDPFGRVIATTEHDPDLVIVDLDLSMVARVRQQIPVLSQKRSSLYELKTNI